PVTLIRATSELALRRNRDAEEYRAALQKIHAHSEHMTRLTDSLLTIAQAESGAVSMPLAPLDLSSLVREVVEEAAAVAQERSVDLGTDVPEEPRIAIVNPEGIERLLLILIDNALKYTPAGGRVTVGVTETNEGLNLSVSDTGPGISREALPHIFERFYRADPEHGSSNGAGLGLSIAQMIAHAHRSVIEVESVPGTGSKFWMRVMTESVTAED
ncbi:MAG: HAMP domain-containing sensor histidine kinase, partial [Acidobacteriota bacterium]